MSFFGKVPDSGYGNTLNDKMREYNILMNDACYANMENGGKPSKKEGQCYEKAVEVCNDIISMNSLDPSMIAKWTMLRDEAQIKSNAILSVLRAVQGTAPPSRQNMTAPAPAPAPAPVTPPPATAAAIPQAQPSAVKTKSGFTTRNACKDVTADTIEGWYYSEPSHDFSNVVGMDELKDRLLTLAEKHEWEKTNKTMGIAPFSCCLFYGPPGTGKTFIIEGFVAELMRKGFTYLKLQSADIHASHVGVAEKTVQIACKEAIDHAPAVLYIDEFEDVSVDRSDPKAEGHEKRLTVAMIEEYNTLVNAGKPIILLAATNHPELIDTAWIDRFKDMRMILPLPNEEQRRLYFERKFKSFPLADGFTFDYIVDKTDNYSYRDLDGLNAAVQSKIIDIAKERYGVRGENGRFDIKASDDPVNEAINSGKISLTKEIFDSLRLALPPTPKEGIIRSLRAYEERVRNFQGE